MSSLLPKIAEPQHKTPMQQAMYDIAELLDLPVDSRGRIYEISGLVPILSYHLARAGCTVDPSLAVIKKRRLPPAPQVMDGAVEWVPLWAPDTVEDELDGKSIADIDTLSPVARAELIRRLGGDPKSAMREDPDVDLSDRVPWRVETSIHFEDED